LLAYPLTIIKVEVNKPMTYVLIFIQKIWALLSTWKTLPHIQLYTVPVENNELTDPDDREGSIQLSWDEQESQTKSKIVAKW